MQCVAVIQATRPGIDSIILWAREDGQLIAYAYQNGRVQATRPLNATTIDQAIPEIRDNFQITTAQLTRTNAWQDTIAAPTSQIGPTRWN